MPFVDKQLLLPLGGISCGVINRINPDICCLHKQQQQKQVDQITAHIFITCKNYLLLLNHYYYECLTSAVIYKNLTDEFVFIIFCGYQRIVTRLTSTVDISNPRMLALH